MKIDRAGQIGAGARVASSRRAGGTVEFHARLDRAVGGRQGPSLHGVESPIPASALLALQEVEPLSERRRRRLHHARSLLDDLDRLRLALLEGSLQRRVLEDIRSTLRQRPEASGDDRLEAIVREVELRTEVELAKLEKADRR